MTVSNLDVYSVLCADFVIWIDKGHVIVGCTGLIKGGQADIWYSLGQLVLGEIIDLYFSSKSD